MTQTPTVPTVTSEKLNHSDKLFREIEESEGFSATPYLDSAGLPTIGKGSRFYENGQEVTCLLYTSDAADEERCRSRWSPYH